MIDIPSSDWNPQSPDVQQDQRAAYDAMRERCPVAYSEFSHWSVFRHADVKRVLLDPLSFSNQVSRHVSVPNGMDGAEHARYRRVLEPYFSDEQIAAFKPQCQALADRLAQEAFRQQQVELMADFAEPFAAQLQCAFMGWSPALAPILLDWSKRSNAAVFNADRSALAVLAQEFEALMNTELALRRTQQSASPTDLTSRLLQEKVAGQPLTDAQIASILRNWTVGEVGTLASSIGIIAQFLAVKPEVQQQLRAQPERLWQANDEILRLHNPLTDNRRRTACPVQLGGKSLAANQRLTLNWVAANRDPEVFERADEFLLERDQSQNLLYGAGAHLCPGAGLARMELVVAIRALFQHSAAWRLSSAMPPQFARYPMSGYATLPLHIKQDT